MWKIFKDWFKKRFKFKLLQIPVFLVFTQASVACLLCYSKTSSAHYDMVADEISRLAKNTTNKQLTADFYPKLSTSSQTTSNLKTLINDITAFNRSNYSYYRGNGHKIRVIANGEGRKDYVFPDLPVNPTFILQTSFSTAWGEEHLYENCDLNLLNTKNNYGENKNRNKFFFINETDALYLIEHNERFYGKTLQEVVGQTLPLHYKEHGVKKTENWTIANVIMADQLDDKLYKSLYTSYIISDYALPVIDNSYCVAFDFSSNIIDNSQFLMDLTSKFSDYDMKFDTRNMKRVDNDVLKAIRAEFYGLSNYESNELMIFGIVCGVILVLCVGLYFWCLKAKIPSLTTSFGLVVLALIVYYVFFIGSKIFPVSIIALAFNSFSIMSLIFLTKSFIISILFSSPQKEFDLSLGGRDEDIKL